MTPTRLLIGQILVVFAIVIAGVWAATQWCAAALGYAAAYEAAYGEAESVADLVPYMLQSFLAGDRGFAKARNVLGQDRARR